MAKGYILEQDDGGIVISGEVLASKVTVDELKASFITRNLVPADLSPSRELHFRPDDLTVAGALASWTDESGNSNDITPEGTNPVVALDQANGYAEVQFNGTSQFATGSTVPGEVITFVAVIQPGSFANFPGIARGNATNGINFGLLTDGKLTLGQRGVVNFTSSNTALTLGQRSVVVGTYNVAGDFAYFLNGSADGTGNDNRTIATQIMQVGTNLDIDMNEIIVYNSVLSTDDRQKLEGYLAWKYGIQSQLPTSHPYSAAVPTVSIGRGKAMSGGEAHPSAISELNSTTQGFLPPRMTTTQRDAIASPAKGLEIFNITTNEKNIFDGVSWDAVWKTWTPTFTGFSTDPSIIQARYKQIGKVVFVRLQTGNGTSDATTFTLTLPVAASSDGKQFLTIAQITNNGAFDTSAGLLKTNTDSTTADIYRNGDQGTTAWSNVGGKKANFFITYESN